MKRVLESLRRVSWFAVFAAVGSGCPTQESLPRITGLGPQGTLAGSPGFALTIQGERFTGETTVVFGGVSKSVRFINAQTIEIDVDASEVASPAGIEVRVANPGLGTVEAVDADFATFNVAPVEVVTVTIPPGTPTALDGIRVFATTDLATLTAEASGTAQVTTSGGSFLQTFTRDVSTAADWSSSDDGVATVTDGLLGPQGEGFVTLEATLEGITGSASAHVIDPAKASVQPPALNMEIGDLERLKIVTTNGVLVDAIATWSSDATSIASVDNGGSTPGLVAGVAEGTATVTASLLGESLTSAITVSCTVGCGGGGTSADRVFIVELAVPQQGFSIPFDRATNTLGAISAPITLTGSPSGTAYDPTDNILLVRTGTGFDAFRNEAANLVALGGTAVPNANFIGFHRFSPTLGVFTAVDAFSGSKIHSITVDAATGAVTMGTAVANVAAGGAFDHGFVGSGAGEANYIHLSPGGHTWGKGTIEPDGSLSGVSTFPLTTGMTINARVVMPPDESFAAVLGNGIVFMEPDGMGDLVPRGPPLAPVMAQPGFAFNRSASCGVAFNPFGDDVEPFRIVGSAPPISNGAQSIPDFTFLDGLIPHPEDDVLFAVGRSAGDESVIEVLEIDPTTCVVTPSGNKAVLPVGPGFVTGSVVH